MNRIAEFSYKILLMLLWNLNVCLLLYDHCCSACSIIPLFSFKNYTIWLSAKKRSTFLLLFVQTLHMFENAKNSATNRNQKHSQKLVWLILRFVFTESTFSFASNFIQYGISFEQWIRKWPKFLLQLHTLTNFETTIKFDRSVFRNQTKHPDLDKYESLRPYRAEFLIFWPTPSIFWFGSCKEFSRTIANSVRHYHESLGSTTAHFQRSVFFSNSLKSKIIGKMCKLYHFLYISFCGFSPFREPNPHGLNYYEIILVFSMVFSAASTRCLVR